MIAYSKQRLQREIDVIQFIILKFYNIPQEFSVISKSFPSDERTSFKKNLNEYFRLATEVLDNRYNSIPLTWQYCSYIFIACYWDLA
jgi:hypothetical protein